MNREKNSEKVERMGEKKNRHLLKLRGNQPQDPGGTEKRRSILLGNDEEAGKTTYWEGKSRQRSGRGELQDVNARRTH